MTQEGIGGNEEMPAADHNYNDDPSLQTRTKVSSTVVNVKAGKQLKLHLQASGGTALRFVPVR